MDRVLNRPLVQQQHARGDKNAAALARRAKMKEADRLRREEVATAKGKRGFLEDVLQWDDEKLERTHDYIQWMFPTDQESAFNASAPDFPEALQVSFRSARRRASRGRRQGGQSFRAR